MNIEKNRKNTLNQIDLNKINKSDENIIIYYDPLMHEGLIGIIAARLKDLFNKPSFVITNSNRILKSSARWLKAIILVPQLKNNRQDLIINGGGHSMAAGFI